MNDPIAREVQLQKDYRFQYENLVLVTQCELYLLIEEEATSVQALKLRGARSPAQ
jgi:hypothetical protein